MFVGSDMISKTPPVRPRGWQKPPEPYRVNNRITAPYVRVVCDGVDQGSLSLQEALRLAEDRGLDLIEVFPNGDPPVCKIEDYARFRYAQQKKEKLKRANAQKVQVKEIRLGPNISEHDFEFKRNHALKFLQEDAKVCLQLRFRGREIMFKEKGEAMLRRFAESLAPHGVSDAPPKLEGKRMSAIVVPVSKKGKAIANHADQQT